MLQLSSMNFIGVIFSYIFWEFNIIKELGFEVSLPSVKLNDKANSKNYPWKEKKGTRSVMILTLRSIVLYVCNKYESTVL